MIAKTAMLLKGTVLLSQNKKTRPDLEFWCKIFTKLKSLYISPKGQATIPINGHGDCGIFIKKVATHQGSYHIKQFVHIINAPPPRLPAIGRIPDQLDTPA